MRNQEALEYHRFPTKGKIEIRTTKPTATRHDLTMAYSPGVAVPCMEIHRDRELAYEYTIKSNLVAVISNGTAVLGLGNIGAHAAKPVMEGKAVLFKKFANIDVFDLELDETDPVKIVEIVKALAPTFGGINLEDIKAPECFYIETELKQQLDLPVFHDDQHGTAIISGAALLNALELVNKNIADVKVVVSGAGASGISCARFYLTLGVTKKNILLVDSRGVIYQGRDENMEPNKAFFAADTKLRTLADALKDCDVFVGLSSPNIVSPAMVATMAKDPIIFALANPDPEIPYPTAKEARPDAILATGRSDYPNPVNNVLGFPFIFRGALDVHAREINEPMKLAATHALAKLVKEDTPDEVLKAYGVRSMHFGRDYLIPTPFDPRVLLYVAPAVAQAAIDSGVARITELDMDDYRDRLAASQSVVQETARRLVRRARKYSQTRVVFPEAHNETILRACHQIVLEGIAQPVLIGEESEIQACAQEYQVSLEGVEIVDNRKSPLRKEFARHLFQQRQRKGMELHVAELWMERPVEFGLMMVKTGNADTFVGGITRSYPNIIRPALQIVGLRDGMRRVSGFYMLLYRNQTLFLADTTVNEEPDAEVLAEIAISTAKSARFFGITPNVAMLSYSNFGSVRNAGLDRITRALQIVKAREPGLAIDGEMQAHLSLNEALRKKHYPFSEISGSANVLIFPNLHAANSAYRLLSERSEGEIIGPILMGMAKPVNVLSQEALVQDVVHITAISALEAHEGVI